MFFTDQEVSNLQQLVQNLGFRTSVTIYARSTVSNSGGQADQWTTTGPTVLGWLYSTPTKEVIINAGEQVTANTYRLYLPVGTAIDAGYQVQIGDDTYTVTDTVHESSWLPLLNCGLRKIR